MGHSPEYSPLPSQEHGDSTDSRPSSLLSEPVDAQEAGLYGVHWFLQRKPTLRIVIFAIVCQFALIVSCGLGGFFVGRQYATSSAIACLDTPWDSLKNEAIQFETRTFNGHFEVNSEYQGAPNKSIDAKWSGITQLYNYGVDHETLVKANKTKGLVQWPGTDKYMVGLEMFHHLHCLNYIRMYTYMDYYQGINADMLAEPLEERTNHKDHCIEMIRQKLMCTPDLNVYSYHWLGNLNHPYTDFKTEHRCVNWDRLYEWSKTKIVRHGVLDKPEGVETLF